ncbi:MAG: 30S ribosomal protein S8 [Candidatus Pacebacteria bacterium]|jgi:small subunit ribosomal protein S8|nr:30S ribosomal protein S8 [Candidatus Paceibacterota bacterium]
MTDPIADMIIRIKNASMAGRKDLVLPHSKLKEEIIKILKINNYIEDYQIIDEKPQKNIKIILKYVGKLSVITDVKRVSKPGRRIYVKAGEVPQTLNGYGLTILSSNQGVIDDKAARKAKVGGEIICQIW